MNDMNENNNSYNIKNYSDDELYKILNLDNDVSDRILEAKILELYKKYNNLGSEAGNKLSKFFKDMHSYFFSTSEDVVENFQTENDNNNDSIENQIDTSFNNNNDIINDENKDDEQIILTKEVTTSKGKSNPLILQTIRRVVSIDSQYRDDKSKIATEFTFNLSEPLKDVVSISLYSVQIPYTWYTVNSNFGSNFFILKGDSPGINSGNFEFKVEITPGNYTAENLVIAINNSFQTIKSTTNDLSFSDTAISYNENNQLTTMNIFIEQNYWETSYYLDFINWTQSYDILKRRNESIAAFFGFQERIYYFDTLISYRDSIGGLKNTNYIGSEDTIKTFWIDSNSNTFKIIRYKGTELYEENVSTEDISMDITLDLNWSTDLSGSVFSREEIVNSLNRVLSQNIKLSYDSQISRINANENELGYNEIEVLSKSYYSLKIFFDRETTNNDLGLKTYVEFPDESNIPDGYNNIWVGKNSCFRFREEKNELSHLLSEYPTIPLTTNKYPILRNPYIELRCKKEYFNIPMNNYKFTLENSYNIDNAYRFVDGSGNRVHDVSYNFELDESNLKYSVYRKDEDGDYIDFDGNKITQVDSLYPEFKDINGYTLNNYINILNLELKSQNDETKNSRNLSGDFIMENSTFLITDNSEIGFNVDIKKKFRTDQFFIILTDDSFLIKTLGYNKDDFLDLSNNILETIVGYNPIYTVFKNHEKGHLLMTIYPKNDHGNKNMPPIEVFIPFLGDSIFYFSIEEMQESISTAISETLDYESDTNTLSNTKLSFVSYNNDSFKSILNLDIQKILTENDFDVIAVDPGYNFGLEVDVISWREHLYFLDIVLDTNQGLSLSNESLTYTEAKLGSRMIFDTISITSINNTLKLIPYLNGVQDNYNTNDIILTIDVGEYNRDQLIEKLNQLLQENPLTSNSKIKTILGKSSSGVTRTYSDFRIEIRKQFNASDYKIIFYDPFSFAACYPGVQSVRTATFDNTLGWTLGFRQYTTYYIRSYTSDSNNYYKLIGNTTVSTDLYNYLLITLDDFNQNHLNDGLVTIADKDRDISNPAYADKSKYKCDPSTGRIVYETVRNEDGNQLTQAQLYSISEIANNKISTVGENTENYGDGPFVKDVFGIIPIKTAALRNGNVYVEFGGTLQNQERKYFGPVNISRMAVKLLSDKGDVMNLNGSNWSFSLIAEQLYTG